MLRLKVRHEDMGSDLIQHITNSRFRQKKNTFIAIVGKSGEGKSMAALRIAQIIQPSFNPIEQIVYTADQFLSVIQLAIKKHYKVIILDEAQTTISNREWFDFANLAVAKVASTFRQLGNLVVIIVTPNVGWIEKKIREMLDYYGVVKRNEGGPAYLQLKEVWINYFDLKDQSPLLKTIVFATSEGVRIADSLEVGLPSQKLIDEYEPLAKKFKGDVIDSQLAGMIKKMERSKEKEDKTLDEIVDILLNKPTLLKRMMKKSKFGFRLRKGDIKALYKLNDDQLFELEQVLIDKTRNGSAI